MKIELEITPEIEELIKPCVTIPYDGTDWNKKFMQKVGHLLGKIAHEAVKAKNQPGIKKIQDCSATRFHHYRDKINEIIDWINNHD